MTQKFSILFLINHARDGDSWEMGDQTKVHSLLGTFKSIFLDPRSILTTELQVPLKSVDEGRNMCKARKKILAVNNKSVAISKFNCNQLVLCC